MRPRWRVSWSCCRIRNTDDGLLQFESLVYLAEVVGSGYV